MRTIRSLFAAALCLALPAAAASPDLKAACDRIAAAKGKQSDVVRLHALFDAAWDWEMAQYPTWATDIGYPGHDAEWTDLSPAAIAARKAAPAPVLAALATIDRAGLPAGERVNYDLFKRDWEESRDRARFPEEYLQISPRGGVQQDVPQVCQETVVSSAAGWENLMRRVETAPRYIAQSRALLQAGLKAKILPPRIALSGLPAQFDAVTIEDPAKHPVTARFFGPKPPELDDAAWKALQARAAKALKEGILPEYRALRDFVVGPYLAGSPETIGMSNLPGGREWYLFLVRSHTTTTLTPDEIHALGLKLVAELDEQMKAVMKESGFTGTMPEFLEYLRTDPKFFHHDRASLLTAYRDIAKRADAGLPRLFGKLPRLPYGVIPVPDYSEQSQTTAYYRGGSIEAGRPGYFYANLYRPETRPKWEMEALTIHEAVPGHHLQIALAQEQGGLPAFRQHGGYTAFVEGWGLYSETLGYDIGMYEDPYSHFGALTYQMWRAVRLVVDTGMHWKGWTRQQAIDFFKAHSSKPEHDITVEVDRYITDPGQALAYMIGKRKIVELRERAKVELGAGFDIRRFHDALLGEGPLPLDVLEIHMNEWIAAEKARLAQSNR